MLDFELPFVSGNVAIDDAIKETIDSDKPGVLFAYQPGELRLVHAYSMLQAATDSQKLLDSVIFEPVETVLDSQLQTFLNNATMKFGFRGMQGPGLARLVSVSEKDGHRYTTGSPGRRCTRPGKPSHISDRNWYHYPPGNEHPTKPGFCRYDPSKLQ